MLRGITRWRRGRAAEESPGVARQSDRRVSLDLLRETRDVVKSVLEAIKQGIWDYEPEGVEERRFTATRAMPGTEEKLEVLAARIRAGLPLWHQADRRDYDDGA